MLPAANRPVPEVLLVVQVRIKAGKDRIVGRHVPVGAAVGGAAALHEPEMPDGVSGPVADDERGLATGGQGDVLRQREDATA